MKKILFFLALLGIAFASCKKYESPQNGDTPVPVFHSYQIGEYFHNDTLEGIVFHTIAGGTGGLMVGLDETLLPWCETNYINSQTGATNPYDGWNNTNILMDVYDMRHYPAILWSYQKNTWNLVHYEHRKINNKQWYVPSSNELRYLLLNQEAVNATLKSMGYSTLEDKTYWSSTETGTRGAAAVRVQNGQIVISDSMKTLEYYVRAIRTF